MKEYKRKDQISQSELDSFSNIEVNKIIGKSQSKREFSLNNLISRSIYGLSFIALFVIIGIDYFLSDDIDENNYFNIVEVSAYEYLVEAKAEERTFYLYYTIDVVYENDRISLNDLFDYNMKYTKVPDYIADTIDLDFEVFQLNQYRYFVMSYVEGIYRYTEFDYFPGHSFDVDLGALDIVDFENDIKDIFEMIELYPPIYLGKDEYGFDKYDIDQRINDINDERLKNNYINYVTNYYVNEFAYGEEVLNEITTMHNTNIIVLDDNNEVIKSFYNMHIYGDAYVALEDTVNLIDDSFRFYPKEGNELYGSSSVFKDDLYGRLSSFYFDGERYGYLYIQNDKSIIDLSNISYVEYDYKLYGNYDSEMTLHTITLDAYYIGDNLFTQPYDFVTTDQTSIVSFFRYFNVRFYDETDNLIYEYTIIPEY